MSFFALVQSYQKKYNYKPEEVKEDTKTKVLRALLNVYKVESGWFSKKTKDARIRGVYITDDLEKNGKAYEDSTGLLYFYMNTPDIHEALIEITKQTGIRFEYRSYTGGYYIVHYLPEETVYAQNSNDKQAGEYIPLTKVNI